MKKRMTYLLFLICFALFILELLANKSTLHFDIEKHFLLFAVTGFFSTFFYVFIANVFKKVVLKDENFYDKH